MNELNCKGLIYMYTLGTEATATLPVTSAVYSLAPECSQYKHVTVVLKCSVIFLSLSGFCLLSMFISMTTTWPFLKIKMKLIGHVVLQ